MKRTVMLFPLAALLLVGCVVEDEAFVEDQILEEGEDLPYAAGTCTIIWYDADVWYRIRPGNDRNDCSRHMQDVAEEHCAELRNGAPGMNPLFVEMLYRHPNGYVDEGWTWISCAN